MGLCGVELYQSDIALDVKSQFEEMYNTGTMVQEITDRLIEDYKNLMGDIKKEPFFWLALADTQWDFGVLMPLVKEKALYWIEKESIALNCQLIDISVYAKKREKKLKDLQTKLLSPQPPEKKTTKKKIYRCRWEMGDVFAYKLESELAKEKGLSIRYFLIQKIDEGVWYPDHIVPIVYIKITRDTNLPSTIEEYNQLEYVQTWATKYEERFWPIDMKRPQEDIAEKTKINYQVDEFGLLPQYRAILLNLSEKMIPKKLIYLGNYMNATRPAREFIPHSKDNIVPVSWKHMNESFETIMIRRYCGHNLRELSIYQCSGLQF